MPPILTKILNQEQHNIPPLYRSHYSNNYIIRAQYYLIVRFLFRVEMEFSALIQKKKTIDSFEHFMLIVGLIRNYVLHTIVYVLTKCFTCIFQRVTPTFALNQAV